MSMDLSLLPPPDVVEALSFEAILEGHKQRLIDLYPVEDQAAIAAVLALESEPLTRFLEVVGYYELTLRARINDAARQVMLAYASGANLDHLAALLGVERLVIDAGDPAADPPIPPTYESDSALRLRTQLAPEGMSTAGPRMSYIYHARSASAQVRDAYAERTLPGLVRVVILAQPSAENPDGVPGAPLLDTVAAALSADDIRPVCADVNVEAATVVPYAIAATLYLQDGPDQSVVLAAAQAAALVYADTQFALGRDIAVSGLHAALHRPGVVRVDLTSPADGLIITNDHAARCTGIALNNGGTAW
ncbi:MAG: baseplate J/gp47 family protein [Georgfuchsia sp.]